MTASTRYTPPPPSLWPRRFAIAALLGGIVAALWWGWHAWINNWMPDAARWPTQGVAISAANAPIGWASLARNGASFVYMDATRGSQALTRRFTEQQNAAMTAGMRVGAIHHFDICAAAHGQAAAFVRLVPRVRDALPPAVLIDEKPGCRRPPTRALLLTELTTFLTQVETHMGKVAVVAPSAGSSDPYDLAAAVNRPLWLRSARAEPAVNAGQWTIWQANDSLLVAGSNGPTRWLVANDGTGTTTTGSSDDAR